MDESHAPGDRPQTRPPIPAQPSRRRPIGFLLRLLVCVALLAIVLWSADLGEVARTLSTAHVPTLLIVCAVVFVDRGLMAFKWNLLLHARNIGLPQTEALRLYLSAHVLATVTPGAIGGDAYRVAVLARPGRTSAVVSTVLIEKVIGLAVLGGVAALMVPFSAGYLGPDSTAIAWWSVGLAVATLGALILSLYPSGMSLVARRIPFLARTSVYTRLRDFYRVYAEYRNQKTLLLLFALLTTVELFLLIVVNFLAARALGLGVSFLYFVSVMPLLHLLVRLPVSFHGIGIQEGLFVYFLAAAGFSAADGLSVSLLLRGLEILCVILPGALILWLAPVGYARATEALASGTVKPSDERSS